VIFEDLHLVPDLAKAHGTVMGVTFVIVFPLGAVLMRVAKFKGAVWVHAAVQLLGWALMIAGLGLGVRLGKIVDYVSPASFGSLVHFKLVN
jgi:predicted phage tail protein